jgi:pullulanase
VGLPLEGTGQGDIYKPLLADPKLAPAKADIEPASAVFREFLQIRKSSKLFRFETQQQIKENVSFYNTSPEQIPGLIVMRLTYKENIDSVYEEIVVLFNAGSDSVTLSNQEFAGRNYTLNSVQQASDDALVRASTFDSATGTFSVAGRTTAVFNILQVQPAPEPVATATQAKPATPVNNMPLTIVAVVGGLIAVIAFLFALRRKDNRQR